MRLPKYVNTTMPVIDPETGTRNVIRGENLTVNGTLNRNFMLAIRKTET
jgi:hypothetical protein